MPLLVPRTYQDVLYNYRLSFDKADYQPFVWPYRAIGPYLLILYLLLPPIKNRFIYFLRYPLFAAIIYLSSEAISECRSPMVTIGYGIGLLNAWAIVWSAALIIFNDARADFKRIEGHRKQGDAKWKARSVDNTNRKAIASARELTLKTAILRAGHFQESSTRKRKETNEADNDIQYVWQAIPSNFLHRLDWVSDLVASFRGPGWSYQISGLAPPPPHIQASLADPALKPPTPSSNLTRADLLRHNLPYFLLVVIIMDGLKSVMMQDPYFWSLGPEVPSPLPYPRLSRTLLSATMTFFSLQGIFLLAPLGLGVLLGPELLGEQAWPWKYTPFYGSLREISKHGLAGVWGRWWHQLFRFGFEQGGEFAARTLGGDSKGWGKKGQKGLLLRVVVAFTLSGTLHACASYTSMLPTRPLNAFTFFAIQPVGLLGQKAIADWMKRNGWREKIPNWIREVGNVVFVFVWFYFTGPIIADDFAGCGIWLYEPVPFSIFRGMSGQGWWFWGGTWVRWHTAQPWWKSGLAF